MSERRKTGRADSPHAFVGKINKLSPEFGHRRSGSIGWVRGESMEYFAHSENDQHEKHYLHEHLSQTARLAQSFCSNESYAQIFKIAGLLHDLGKYQPAFQKYLLNGGERGSVPHASWGAGFAKIQKLIDISIAIDGHHKGLPDKAVWKNSTAPYVHGDEAGFDDVVNTFLADLKIKEGDLKPPAKMKFSEFSQHELFTRYLFSALTDADWLSTEGHFDKTKAESRGGFSLPVDEMICKLEHELSGKSKEGSINKLRNTARKEALDKAFLPPSFYSLALPTGLGKTLTSISWALQHARQNKLKRIIIVLPYINIIDQTAQILKDIFGEQWILEHHSSYNEGLKDDEKLTPAQERKRLATENWDYPIIVTTTVQFFESLFSNRPSKCRKIHNIAESVVIFDEVQTIPKDIILPTLQILKDIQVVMNSSFLFCTATQPAFGKRRKFDGIDGIQPLIEDSAALFDATQRVEYRLLADLKPLDYDELAHEVTTRRMSTLVIFNTKKAALEFFNRMVDIGNWEERYHLSTSMCPCHRKEVIGNIKDDLGDKKNILVVSTQLIEAGVDFDFPLLFRAMAPLEGIIQAAGRCNREGDPGKEYGQVYIFKIKDGGMPDKTYAACAGLAEEFIKSDISQLYRHDVFEKYYSHAIDLYVEPDRYGINKSRKEFNFKVVSDSYHIIQKPSDGLYIYNFNEESKELLHSLHHKEFLSRSDYRMMQQFSVQVYENFIFQNSEQIQTMPQGFKVWYGNYDLAVGISLDPIAVEQNIV